MSESRNVHDTPAMRQYRRFKEQYPGCVLFFRMGDFYEMFYDDALLAHRTLGVTLTQRTARIPMAGVPFHAVESYLRRMIQAGHRVAVCDQVEDPAQAKGIVQREVTRLVTPGTLTDEALLEEGRENPLAAVLFGKGERAHAAWVELSTGAFHLASLEAGGAGEELARVGPREMLYVDTADGRPPPRVKALLEALRCPGTGRPAWQFRQAEAVEVLCRQFGVASLAGFGLRESDPCLGPAGALVAYLLETQRSPDPGAGVEPRQRTAIAHLRPPRRFERSDHLVIDATSLGSLEIERTARSGGTEGSLLGVLQGCATPMGKRTLRQWLCFPLARREAIEARQAVVQALVDDPRFLDELRAALAGIQDVQRMLGRVSVGRAAPRDLTALGLSAAAAPRLAELLEQRPTVLPLHARAAAIAPPLARLGEEIGRACVDSPPGHLRDGGVIRDGYDAALDEFRHLQRDSHSWLAEYQKRLIEQTGIATLKVGFNKIFGYYIELTAAQRDKAPPQWARKQTLKNAERFITPELKDFEGKVLTAEARAVAREGELFFRLCTAAVEQAEALQEYAAVVAELDVLACFARRAVKWRYVRPRIVDEPVLHVRGGRHPVLDELLGDRFVPNDVSLGRRDSPDPAAPIDTGSQATGDAATDTATAGAATLALITGPNMAGKSTYIRTAALITLLAHTGSFVPAEEAVIGRCDRVFTRIGASDELHAGASTFMVEMTETANLCHHATPSSLVILDEIGRGTSTLDGLALAWAIAEHLAARGCRTLFATHYHELTALAQTHPAVTNLHVTVREWQDQIVFLHRIVPGATDRSYGIHVAKIAGLPPPVVQRAHDILGRLEVSHADPAVAAPGDPAPADAPRTGPARRRGRRPDPQMTLFTEYLDHPALTDLRQVDLNSLSPLQAFDLLRRLQERARGEGA